MHIVLLKCPHVQISFLKFTSCDNQVLVGCIPIAAVAVHLNLKSWKLVSRLMRSIAITVNFQVSRTILNACSKKSGKLLNAPRIYSAPVSGVNRYIQKGHSTISYERLTKEFTRFWGGTKCSRAKRSMISPNIKQLFKSTLKVFNRRLFMAMSQSLW